jgi:hypothetical protein
MKTKIAALICLSIVSCLAVQKPAYSEDEPNKFEDVKMSMSQLINSGWQVISMAGEGGDLFLLTKNGEYIRCDVYSFRDRKTSTCRRLN